MQPWWLRYGTVRCPVIMSRSETAKTHCGQRSRAP